jgi:hypothetical protein
MEDGIQFDDATAFDDWLQKNGATARELWAIIFKKLAEPEMRLMVSDLERVDGYVQRRGDLDARDAGRP